MKLILITAEVSEVFLKKIISEWAYKKYARQLKNIKIKHLDYEETSKGTSIHYTFSNDQTAYSSDIFIRFDSKGKPSFKFTDINF